MVETPQGLANLVGRHPGLQSEQKYHLYNRFVEHTEGPGPPPFRTKILDIRDHFHRAFRKFETTVSHLFSDAVKNRPRHLNDYNTESGCP